MNEVQLAKYKELVVAGLTPELAQAEALKVGAAAPAAVPPVATTPPAATGTGLDALNANKGTKNATLIAILAANGISMEKPIVVDIKPVTNRKAGLAPASTVYVMSYVDKTSGSGGNGGAAFEQMNAFELEAQKFNRSVMRAMMTVDDTIIASSGIAKGGEFKLKFDDGRVVEAELEVHERFSAFSPGQQAVGYTENGIFKESLVDGKPYYRTAKITPRNQAKHQLIGMSVASVTE